jgi:hypothetical protein
MGHTDDTDADATYVYSTPLELNCWPFMEIKTEDNPAPDDTADEHSTQPESMYRADTVLLASSKRHTSVDDSRK